MEPHGFTNLGGLEKPLDTRDIKLGAAAAPVYTFPPTLTNAQAWAQAVEYQGQQPACGAHSGSELEGITRKSRYSPRWAWFDIKSFDQLPLDSGTNMRAVFQSVTKGRGSLDFSLLGNDVTLSEQDYAHPAITPTMTANAAQTLGYGYGFIADLTFNGIKQFIANHGPCIILLQVGDEWWTAANGTGSWAEKDILPLGPPKLVVSGHFVVLHSYDENYIYFLNSWGNTWGRAGHGYFGANYMPFVNDVGALFSLVFNKDLYLGLNDSDVKLLQQTLNKNPLTQVAITGAGSPGQETSVYGPLTKAAVIRFQRLNNISPQSGYCGPLTRAVLNSAAV